MFNNNYNNNFLSSIPVVTRNILFINLIVWGACNLINYPFSDILGLHYFRSGEFNLYQLLTYQFTHTQFLHLFFNMFALYMFGRVLENYWGSSRFLTYYLITGIGAGLVQLLVLYIQIHQVEAGLTSEVIKEIYSEGADLLSRNMNYSDEAMGHLNLLINSGTIGASGAVFGILLAFGMIFPNVQLMIIPIPIPIKAKYLVIGYGVLELSMGFANFSGDNVAHFAHLGGMLFGIILILYWRRKNGNFRTKDPWSQPWTKKITNIFKRKPKMTVHKRPETDWDYNARKADESKEIDRILEKIKYSGYNSLSENEKKKLFDAGKK